MTTRTLTTPVFGASLLLAGCPSSPPDPPSSDMGSIDGDSSGTGEESPMLEGFAGVDILFVVDNSGEMGPAQAKLARALPSLVDRLEGRVDFRLGVTTTDNGNPWCAGTSPEAGALRATSCRSRAEDFVFNGPETIDQTQAACLDVCSRDEIEISGTRVYQNGATKKRPWIERIADESNVGGGVSLAEAASCIVAQGINGCGFESPLESMYKSLRRSELPESEDAGAGFWQINHLLGVVFVTNEADCSYNNEHEIIFLPDGNRIFWSLPDEGSPTSAACWNAGVVCDGGGPTYSNCRSQDFTTAGNHASDPNDAVLRPLVRYADALASNESVTGDVAYVAAIVGVRSDSAVVYDDGDDAEFRDNFGIGPGCNSDGGAAVPPVRLREIAEAFGGQRQNLFSICDDDYGSALRSIADELVARVED